MEPPPGLEPGTFSLQKSCSTAELRWQKKPPELRLGDVYKIPIGIPNLIRRSLSHNRRRRPVSLLAIQYITYLQVFFNLFGAVEIGYH